MTPTPQTQVKPEGHMPFSGYERVPSDWDTCEKGYQSLSDFSWATRGITPLKSVYPWENHKSEFPRLAEAIKISEELKNIHDDSEFGGPKPPDRETWFKGCEFLWKLGKELDSRLEKELDPPHIAPTSGGGLSFCWDKEDYRMLITIRPDNGPVTYYGDDTKWKNTRKGETSIDNIDLGLIAWFGGVQ